MVETKLSPVAHNVPIADPDTGYITPYFQRMLQTWLKEKAAAEEAAITLESLGGDPGADRLILWDDSAGEFSFVTLSEVLDGLGTTHGSIIYRDSADWQVLAPGTAGQVLQTNGSGADPSWASGTGSLVLIQEVITSASQSTVTFSSIPDTYRDLMIRVRGRSNRASNSSPIIMRCNNDSGANYDTDTIRCVNSTLSGFSHAGSTSNYIGDIVAGTGPANAADCIEAIYMDYKGTTFTKAGTKRNSYKTANSAAGVGIDHGAIWWRNTAAINRLDVLDSFSTFVNGSVVSLYGLM